MLLEIAEMAMDGILVIVFLVMSILCVLAFPRALKETLFGPREIDTVCVLSMCILFFVGWIATIGLVTGW